MAERRKRWFQREPYPTIVAVLINHELLTEGGTRSLQLASRVLTNEEDPGWARDPVGAITAQLVAEGLDDGVTTATLLEAAQDIADALVEWRAPAEAVAVEAQPDVDADRYRWGHR